MLGLERRICAQREVIGADCLRCCVVVSNADVTLEDIERDLREVHLAMPARALIQATNDRNRIMIQRAESEQYRAMLKDSLETPAKAYIDAGITPAGILREFREAVGMVQSGPSVALQQQTNIFDRRGSAQRDPLPQEGGITSAEDLIRKVVETMGTEDTLGAALGPDDPIEEAAGDMPPEEPAEADIPEEDDDTDIED